MKLLLDILRSFLFGYVIVLLLLLLLFLLLPSH